MSDSFRIGMIGCGTVGSGVLELLRRRAEDFTRLMGRPVQVTRIAVRDPKRDRPNIHAADGSVPELCGDPLAVTSDPDFDLVVEVAGGVEPARDWIVDALQHGHDVVSANKAALAFHGREIFAAARANARRVYYEASVAAAIPIIESLQNALIGNRVHRLYGILNGTCNYVLTRMEEDGVDYEDALQDAQEKGFAEADPTLDVGGGDTAHKLALLGGIVTHALVDANSVYTEGMTRVTGDDITYAEQLGYRIKLLAVARCDDSGAWEFRVHPAMISRSEILSQVSEEYNAVRLDGDAAGPMLLYGKGAGSLATASSVVADIMRAAKGDKQLPGVQSLDPPDRVEIGEVELRNYVRMTVLDERGTLGRITSVLGEQGISIASIHQPEAKTGQPVPVVLVTHRVVDRVIEEALQGLYEQKLLTEPATRIRIEGFPKLA